jgi:4-amino-4-deoxy-L-arabinose transferase-like glycosyltransferase
VNLKTEQFPLKVALLAFLYLALNAITQGLVSQTADLDQAQQLLLSQELAWGYGRQPPVYTWIVNGVFRITGPEVWSLRLIKVVILFVLVVAILMVGKELALTESQQVLSVLGLALIPQLVWEAQRDLTHSPLATMMGALTLWCVLRLRKQPDVHNYFLLGVLVAAGLLSKFNYAVFLLSVMVGALLTPDYRRLVLSPKL